MRKSCSFWADNFNGIVPHLGQRDVSFVAISRAPLAKLEAMAKRMGSTFKWLLSGGGDFNFDYGVRPEGVSKRAAPTQSYRRTKRAFSAANVSTSTRRCSMSDHRHADELDLERRAVLQTAAAAMVGGLAASTALAAPAAAQGGPRASLGARNNGPLGARLQGVQHFGLTVQNMNRAFEFYTEVLGGTEVMRDGDFHGERIHNTLLTDQEIEARVREVNPRTMGVPDLRGGVQRLDVRFIQFDNVVIELLQYRDAEQPAGSGASFAEPLDHMSPAFPRMMHICFHIRDDVDFNKFITDLEAESARRGMTQVRANRVITVRSDKERLAAPVEANSNSITEGLSNGWTLIYCKGPEGEQLEFVQALGPVKRVFDDAREARQRAVAQ